MLYVSFHAATELPDIGTADAEVNLFRESYW